MENIYRITSITHPPTPKQTQKPKPKKEILLELESFLFDNNWLAAFMNIKWDPLEKGKIIE